MTKEELRKSLDFVNEERERLQYDINNLTYQLAKYKSIIEKAVEYMKDFIFEPLLVQEDRKLIMYNQNLRKFEDILNGRSDE